MKCFDITNDADVIEFARKHGITCNGSAHEVAQLRSYLENLLENYGNAMSVYKRGTTVPEGVVLYNSSKFSSRE